MGTISDGDKASTRLSARNARLLYLGFCLILLGVIGWELADHYKREFTAAAERTQATGKLMSEWLSGTFQASDYLLQSIVVQLDPAELQFPTPDSRAHAQRTELLRQQKHILPDVDEISLFSMHGLTTHTTNPEELPGFDVGDRPFFTALRDNPDLEYFVSPVFRSEVGDSFKIVQSRPVRTPDGRFGGVASIRVDLAFFDQWLNRTGLAARGTVTIFDDRMTLISRRPQTSDLIGQAFDESALRAFLDSGQEMTIADLRSPIDGTHRVYSLSKVADLPFVIIVGEASGTFLADWWRKLWIYANGWVLIAALGLMVLRGYLRMRSDELALGESHRELQIANEHLNWEIDQRRQVEEVLQERESRLSALIAAMQDTLFVFDATGRFVYVHVPDNRELIAPAAKVMHRHYAEVLPAEVATRFDAALVEMHCMGCPVRFEYRFVPDDDLPKVDAKYFLATVSPLRVASEDATGFLCVVQNITERKQAEERISQLAFYDPLTALPNRRLLLDRLQQALAVSGRSGRRGALLFIDLDNFKLLNDSLGHDCGDRVLRQVAQRLSASVREEDTVARLGGDEFVVMLEGLGEMAPEAVAQARTVGEKLLAVLERPYDLGGHRHRSTASIGIALFAGRNSNPEELLKRADQAMYRSKAAGRNTLHVFDFGISPEEPSAAD